MPDLVPDFWRGYLTGTLPKKPTNEIDKKDEKADPQPVMQSQTGDGVYRVGGKVSEPKPVYSRDPQYNPFARANKFQGTSVVSAVILPDGTVSDVKITRPIGLGLDDEAVRAVRTWQFKPAKKNDQPVAVMINVEVNFRLY
jgi:protein TonB